MQTINVYPGFIGGNSCLTVNARELHEFMGVGKKFADWINERIQQYGFQESHDYEAYEGLSFPESGSSKARPQKTKEYRLTLDMAKELAMVERTPKGREARRYFIECEKELHRIKAGAELPPPTSSAPPALEPTTYPATGSPFDNVQAAKLGKLLRANKSAALAYLIECGITPTYVQQVLTAHGVPTLAGPVPTGARVHSAVPPLEYLVAEIPLRADKEDGKFWYLRRETFADLCGDYDVTATARYIRDLGCLRHQAQSLTWIAPRQLFGRRANVFAIAKTLPRVAQEVGHGRAA